MNTEQKAREWFVLMDSFSAPTLTEKEAKDIIIALLAENKEIRLCTDAFEFDAECRKAIIEIKEAELAKLLAERQALLGAVELYKKAGFGNSTCFELQANAFNESQRAIALCEGKSQGAINE
jgi:hypothetical protein